MKKIVASLLTFAMLLSVCTGCSSGSENTSTTTTTTTASDQQGSSASDSDVTKTAIGEYTAENPYQLTFAFIEFYPQDDGERQAVEDALNEYMIPNYHMQVNFLPMQVSDYATKLQLMFSGTDDLDVMPVFNSNASSWVNMGAIEDLTPYMSTEDGQKIVEALGKEKAYVGQMNGILYALPANKESASLTGLCMRADICDELGLTEKYGLGDDVYTGKVYDWSVCADIFQAVKEAHPEITPLYLQGSQSQAGYMGYFDILLDNFGVLDWEKDHDSLTVVNKYETDTYKDIVTMLAQWYDAGYIYPDAVTDTQGSAALMKSGSIFSYLSPLKPGFLAEANTTNGRECYAMYFGQDVETGLRTDNVLYYSTAIASNSKDPEMAFKFVTALYTDPTVMNYWQFGIEGTDYQVLDDGTAYYADGVDATNYKYFQNSGWAMGNQFIGYVWNNGTKDATYWDKLIDRDEWAYYSPAYGFAWDSSDYQTEITALKSALDTYRAALETGSVGGAENVPAVLEQLNSALYAAGLQDVMDAKQEQLDAWIEENGPTKTPEVNLEKINSVTTGVLTE